MKRLFATILSVICLAACTVLFGCDKDVPEPENDGVFKYEYVAETDSYTVIGTVKDDDIELEIPSEYNEKPVTRIGKSAFRKRSKLQSIVIPDTITYIGEYAFSYCESLENVNIPNGITGLETWTFAYCSQLTNLTIPDSVTYLGKCALAGTGLTQIDIPDTLTEIGDYAYAYCESLTSAIIPDTVTELGTFAFALCYNLIEAHIGVGVEVIRLGAFLGTGLTEIYTGNVRGIQSSAFGACDNLERLILSETVQYVSSAIFAPDTSGIHTSCRIEYIGTVEQWESIPLQSRDIFPIYCSDGVVYDWHDSF